MPTPTSMLNKWDYSGVADVCYSDAKCESYKKAAAFLGADQPVEDWGGGTGWAKRYFTGEYKNIDFAPHKKVDVVADLAKYTSRVDNILMKQVLENDERWRDFLDNVKKSFTKKFCLVVGTPLVSITRLGPTNPVVKSDGMVVADVVIQEIYFNKKDILDYFPPDKYKTSEEEIESEQYYKKDWLLYVEKI
jgi:hypothetical protein